MLIQAEQDNPLTLATTPRNTAVPPLHHTVIAETPTVGITHLTQRQTTPESSDEEPPLLLPPVFGIQALPTPLVHHILNIRTGLMAAQPAPQQPTAQTLTVDQLRAQLAKVQDSKILFSGKEDPRAFENRMNLQIRKKGLTADNDKLLEWLNNLSGAALSWAAPFFDNLFDATPNYQRKFSFNDFITKFKQTYAYTNMQDTSRKQLEALEQGQKTVGQYVQQFQSLSHHTGFDDAALLQKFLNSLDKKIRYDLSLMRSDTNMNDAINQAQKLEAIRSGTTNPYADPGQSNRFQPRTSNVQYVPMELDTARTQPAPKCYNCGRTGHLKKNCRSPIKNKVILKRPPFPPRIRAAHIEEVDQVDKIMQKQAAQQDALDTMLKMINGLQENRKEQKDF